VAGITGVHTIRTTGQLIPPVTGVFSLLVALRELMMSVLRDVSGRGHIWSMNRPSADETLLEIPRLEQVARHV